MADDKAPEVAERTDSTPSIMPFQGLNPGDAVRLQPQGDHPAFPASDQVLNNQTGAAEQLGADGRRVVLPDSPGITSHELVSSIANHSSTDRTTRAAAWQTLQHASLGQLLDFQESNVRLSKDHPMQNQTLDSAINQHVGAIWNRIMTGPSQNLEILKDPRYAEALATNPQFGINGKDTPQLIHHKIYYGNDSLGSPPQDTTVKKLESAARYGEAGALCADTIMRLAREPGASEQIREMAGNVSANGTAGRLYASQAYRMLSGQYETDRITDSGSITDGDRQRYAQKARELFLETTQLDRVPITAPPFQDGLHDFLRDPKVSDKEFAAVTSRLTAKALSGDFDSVLAQDSRENLFAMLGTVTDASPQRMALMKKQMDALSQDLERRVGLMTDPQSRLSGYHQLVYANYHAGRMDDARRDLGKAVSAARTLSEPGAAQHQIEYLNKKWAELRK